MINTKTKLLPALVFGLGCIVGGNFLADSTQAIGNAAFTDTNFYSCVVKQFNALYPNEVTVASEPSDTVLTDAQLAKMDRLNCERTAPSATWSLYGNMPSYYELNGPKATSVAGLEKLTGLKALQLTGHDLSSINLSKNINLTELAIGWNGLTEIDLSKNVKISHLGIHEPITSFYEPTLTELSSANLQGCELESIDVSSNKKLHNLLLNHGNSKLKEIDVSNNPNLRGIYLDYENYAFVHPYAEVKTTDECVITARIPILSGYINIWNTNYYTFDSSTSTLTFKERPVKDLINSGYFRTIQTGTEGSVDRVYFVVLPDSVYDEFDKLSSCTPKAAPTPASNTDDASKTDGSIKVPNTGSMQEEQNAKIISISLAALGVAAFVAYISTYIYKRHKNHIKF